METKIFSPKTAVFFWFFLVFKVFMPNLMAQEAPSTFFVPEKSGSNLVPGTADLPRTFRELSLGMSLDDLKAGLKKDELFNFRGDRDVSFLPAREQSLVETTGRSFIRRAFFQLRDGEVFIMAFSLNTTLVDHYSIFTNLVTKYGEPSFLDPKKAVWETENTLVSLERPLTVKYIDKLTFNDIIDEASLIEGQEVKNRREFIDEF
jgi:hypothetical protein